MTLRDIRHLPTTFDKVHESVLRSWHIVDKVKELLELNTPPAVILAIIQDLRAAPGSDYHS